MNQFTQAEDFLQREHDTAQVSAERAEKQYMQNRDELDSYILTVNQYKYQQEHPVTAENKREFAHRCMTVGHECGVVMGLYDRADTLAALIGNTAADTLETALETEISRTEKRIRHYERRSLEAEAEVQERGLVSWDLGAYHGNLETAKDTLELLRDALEIAQGKDKDSVEIGED